MTIKNVSIYDIEEAVREHIAVVASNEFNFKTKEWYLRNAPTFEAFLSYLSISDFCINVQKPSFELIKMGVVSIEKLGMWSTDFQIFLSNEKYLESEPMTIKCPIELLRKTYDRHVEGKYYDS